MMISNIYIAIIVLAAGLIILWKSADLLVAASVHLASMFGISQLLIGLTIVAMGTSAPEVAASVAASIDKLGPIAIGNVYGSNIANLALVAGIAALIKPIRIRNGIFILQLPIMLLSLILIWFFIRDYRILRIEGIVLLLGFAAFLYFTIIRSIEDKKKGQAINLDLRLSEVARKYDPGSAIKNIILMTLGFLGLAIGAKMAVDGAVFAGRQVGLSESVIGLTIIAVGTSLPELVTCVVAALKGHEDISIGNLVGSNIFNTLFVTGIAGSIKPILVTHRLAGADYWIMVSVSLIFSFLAIIGRKIGRLDGFILLGIYLAYIAYLFIFTAGM